jgi:hypothetical protein
MSDGMLPCIVGDGPADVKATARFVHIDPTTVIAGLDPRPSGTVCA